MPKEVVANAKRKLQQLELGSVKNKQQPTPQIALDFIEPEINPAMELLQSIDPDQLTPKEALDLIYQLRKMNN